MSFIYKKVMGGQKGMSLLETVIAMALLGIIAVAFLRGLGTVSAITLITDTSDTAENLAVAQIEYIDSQAYATSYNPAQIPSEYGGYTATIGVESLQDSKIQKITVTIKLYGESLANMESYKVR